MMGSQRERTARVLQLLDESFRAHQAGDLKTSSARAAAACELDVYVVSAVQGGMIIGEVPRPEVDYPAWSEYVAAAAQPCGDED